MPYPWHTRDIVHPSLVIFRAAVLIFRRFFCEAFVETAVVFEASSGDVAIA